MRTKLYEFIPDLSLCVWADVLTLVNERQAYWLCQWWKEEP